MKRKKRRKRRLPRTSSLRDARHQGACAKVTGTRHRHACQAPAASKFSRPSRQLWRRPPSVCVIADNWNDYNGSVTSHRHPGAQFLQGFRLPKDFVPTSFVIQHVPPCSIWRHVGCTCGGQCRQGSGSVRLCWCCLWVNSAWISLTVDFVPSSPVKQYVPRTSRGGVFAVGSVFGWMPRGSRCSAACRSHFT